MRFSVLAERADFEELMPHAADRHAIHNLVAVLERDDPVVLSADYAERLDQARARLCASSSWTSIRRGWADSSAPRTARWEKSGSVMPEAYTNICSASG